MKKLFSLIKAVCSQDMDLFKFKNNGNKFSKIFLFTFLCIILMISFGTYYYMLAENLQKVNLTYLMLALALVIPTIFVFMQGIYKSQNILFEAKDNDLLMSLPISKGTLIFIRFLKMYLYELIYGLLFTLPAILVYVYFIKVNYLFYIVTLIMILMIPIIPIVLSSLIGYLIKRFSIKFKAKKLVQIISTFIMFFVILYFSNNSEGLIENIASNASSINDIITKIYYPIGAYISLVSNFNILNLVVYLIINLLPILLFVYILNKSYFMVINKSRSNSYSKSKEYKYDQKKIMKALVVKDIKRYFSSTVYVFNTFFGLVLMIIATIGLCTNFEKTIEYILSGEIPGLDINWLYSMAPKVFFLIVLVLSFMTSITSSSISIEGKTFNISKSLPIDTKKILLSKVIFSNLLIIPVVLICDVIFFINFKLEIIDYILIILVSLVAPTISSLLGLVINLKYPKMDATSDTEVVKQSISSMISVLSGMVIAIVIGALCLATLFGYIKVSINNMLILCLVGLIIMMIVLVLILNHYGVKRYREIEV